MGFYSKNFIYTLGEKGAHVFGEKFSKTYPGNKITPVSTVGAGDNFNAGIIYGLIKENVTLEDLKSGISSARWDNIARYAIDFSSYVCTTLENYITPEYAKQFVGKK